MDQEQVLALALKLSPEQRAALADRLIESVAMGADDAVDAAWAEELRQRVERLRAGAATTVSWAESQRRIMIAAGRAPNT